MLKARTSNRFGGDNRALKVFLGKDCYSTTFGRSVLPKKLITRRFNISVQNTLRQGYLYQTAGDKPEQTGSRSPGGNQGAVQHPMGEAFVGKLSRRGGIQPYQRGAW
jgi:hypothetical protein